MSRAPIDDPFLGRLPWSAEEEAWVGSVPVAVGLRVEVSLAPDELEGPTDTEALAAVARGIVARLATPAEEAAFRRFAAEELLEDHNLDFHPDAPLDEDGLAARLRLSAVTCYEDGACDIFYDDGDAFDGHTVIVSLDDDGAPDDATVSG